MCIHINFVIRNNYHLITQEHEYCFSFYFAILDTNECQHLAGRRNLPATNVTAISSVACAQQSPPPSQSLSHNHPDDEDVVSSKGTVEGQDTEEAMMQETAALLASLSDVILSPIKTPKVSGNEESDILHNNTEVSGSIHLCAFFVFF